MTDFLSALDWFLLTVGSIFTTIGAIGLIRFPDFYSRIHAVGVTDTLGAGLILLGCGIEAGFSLVMVKLFFVWMFIYFTGPSATHALAKAAYSRGLQVHSTSSKKEQRRVIPS